MDLSFFFVNKSIRMSRELKRINQCNHQKISETSKLRSRTSCGDDGENHLLVQDVDLSYPKWADGTGGAGRRRCDQALPTRIIGGELIIITTLGHQQAEHIISLISRRQPPPVMPNDLETDIYRAKALWEILCASPCRTPKHNKVAKLMRINTRPE